MKSKTTPIIIAILIPLISIAMALSLIYFKKRGFSSNPEFSYVQYLESPRNMSGNRYSLKAELETHSYYLTLLSYCQQFLLQVFENCDIIDI